MVTEPVTFPETTPPVLIVAIVVELLLQVPPLALLVSVIAAASQTEVGPEIVPATGSGLTVPEENAEKVPQLLVTVY